MNVLLPYLDEYWREMVSVRALDRLNLALTSYPQNAPLSCRPDWKLAGGEKPGASLQAMQEHVLDRYQQDITRIEVQLSDENSGKAGNADKRCMMEARLAGLQPIAVNHHGETQDEAFRGAARKLLHALEHSMARSPS